MRLKILITALLMLALPATAMAQPVPRKTHKSNTVLLVVLPVALLAAILAAAGSSGKKDNPKPVSP